MHTNTNSPCDATMGGWATQLELRQVDLFKKKRELMPVLMLNGVTDINKHANER